MKSYGQYCPIARTSEVFAERWTPIIVRNLAAGCRTFTQIRDGAPGIPKALLADRLAMLQRCGVVASMPQPKGRGRVYELTESGRELKGVCEAMGQWGARWLEIEPHHLDPAYVLWATCRLVDLDRVPSPGVVVRFDLQDEPKRRFWMLLQRPRAELCTSYPGRPEDLVVTTDSETLVQWNLRRISFDDGLGGGRFHLEGPASLIKSFPAWVRASPYAHVSRAQSPSPVARTDHHAGIWSTVRDPYSPPSKSHDSRPS